MASKPAPPKQFVLDIGIEIQRDVNGIEMGILENGVPFLTQTGLAKLAGVARSVIFDISQDWEDHYDDDILSKDRLSFIKDYLFRNGYSERKLYIETMKDGSVHNAYPDIVCTAIIEYYAFEAKSKNRVAIDNYRRLATYGLQRFIYNALNYTPADRWKYHHDRISLLKNSAPQDCYIIFHEVTGLIVDLINANLMVNHKTIPDISVGKAWGEHWVANDLDLVFGPRLKYEHNYPEYYPQSASNPQSPWAYPDSSLASFRKWFRHSYLPTKFPKYILSKANLLGGQQEAIKIAALYKPKKPRGK